MRRVVVLSIVADFFVSGGTTINDPDGAGPEWETPIADPNTLETVNV
jgi:hypothetical protein